MADGTDSEGEWEEMDLMVELKGIIDSDWSKKCGNKCKIVGLDSDTPLLQWDRYVFSGEYKDIAGTGVMFEKKPVKTEDGVSFDLKYNCHTFKKLSMVRAFLAEKETEEHTAEVPEEENSCGGGKEICEEAQG